jgi:hypothetical protein
MDTQKTKRLRRPAGSPTIPAHSLSPTTKTMLNTNQLATIVAYISAAVSEAHVSRDLSDVTGGYVTGEAITATTYFPMDYVDLAEQELGLAQQHLDTCFQALPAELQAYLNKSTY